MTIRALKVQAVNVLPVLNTIGTAIVLVVVIRVLFKMEQRMQLADIQTAQVLSAVQKAEREQVNIARCQAVILSTIRGAVTIDQLNSCLQGTSLAAGGTQSSPGSSKASTTAIKTTPAPSAATSPVAPRPATPQTANPNAQQPTTSDPPPTPNPTPGTPPPVPSPIPNLPGLIPLPPLPLLNILNVP